MKKMLQHIVLVILMIIGFQSFAQESEKDLVSFGGHAFTNDFPIELGYAFLHPENDPSKIIDTAIIDTLGYYYFYKKPANNYYISVLLAKEDPNYQEFAYTFYPNTPFQNEAELINIDSDNWELDLIMAKTFKNSNGPGSISGSFEINHSKLEIEGIEMMIIDELNQIVTHSQTDRFGNFEISELDYGTYTLYPQILGFKTIPYHFEISESNLDHENVQIKIENGQISSYINENIIDRNSFLCFPNPANQTLSLSFDFDGSQQIETRVIDVTGRIILEESDYSINNFNKQLNTSEWRNGYYFVDVLVDGSKALSQKIAIIH